MTVPIETRHPTREQALEIAERAQEILKTRFGATRVIVFGSARGDSPWHEGSDLDLAVEGIEPSKFFSAWAAIEREVEPDIQIELVDLDDVSTRMQARIFGDTGMPNDPLSKLKSIVQDELEALAEIVTAIQLDKASADNPPTSSQMRSMGTLVHHFYSGAEQIFERIAVQIDGGVPAGEHWHKFLLRSMNRANEGIRPAVIDDELWVWLEDYRDFRHFFRHAYRKDLEWYKLLPHVDAMPKINEMLHAQLDIFFRALEEMKADES